MAMEAPEHEFICFGDRRAFSAFDFAAPNVRRIEVGQDQSPTIAAASDGSRSPLDMLRLSRAVWREPLDLFFSPSVYTYFPLPPGLRAVVTVHDAIAERFPALTLPSRKARLFWKLKVGLALRQARMVLTVSEYSARDISRVLGVSPHRIRVAVEAPAAAYHPSEIAEVSAAAGRAGLPPNAQWFAYVGGFNPHKRVGAIIRAHAALSAGRADAPHLLLVGTTGGDVFHGEVEELRASIAASGTGHLVHWLGFVPDEELRHLLTGALASLLPSECEGFGLPAVEAAACGTPVIATTESPLPELLEGGGFFVRPNDELALQNGMRALHGDLALRQTMGRRARERAELLTWKAGARAALAALAEAAA